MHLGHVRAALTSPTGSRILAPALFALVIVEGAGAHAQGLTEAEVARRAAAQAPEALVARALAAVADAEIGAAPRHPDPALFADREQTFGDGAPYEMSIGLEVPIDLSGRRAVARHLARAEAAAAGAEAEVARNEAVTAAVLAWVDAIAARRALELEEMALAALDEAARVLLRREEAGTVAGYDRVRLELEAELVRSAVAEAEARLASARELLRVLVAPDARSLPELAGSLEVTDPGPLDRWLARAERHEGAVLAERSRAAADDAVDASGSAWVPALGLALGARVEGAMDTRWGYVAGLSVSVPIFGGDHGLPELARAERAAAEARADALGRRLLAQAATAHQTLVSSRAEVARFRDAIEPRLELLLRGAESGYREGQRTIAELLDARRAAASARRRLLDLEAQAKRAEARLRGAAGGWP